MKILGNITRPNGPSFGANDEAAPCSPPTVLIFTDNSIKI